jgi:hypothetical protein
MTASIQTVSGARQPSLSSNHLRTSAPNPDLFKVSQEVQQACGTFPISFVRIHRAKLLTDLVLQTSVEVSLLQLLYDVHLWSICDTKQSSAEMMRRAINN